MYRYHYIHASQRKMSWSNDPTYEFVGIDPHNHKDKDGEAFSHGTVVVLVHVDEQKIRYLLTPPVTSDSSVLAFSRRDRWQQPASGNGHGPRQHAHILCTRPAALVPGPLRFPSTRAELRDRQADFVLLSCLRTPRARYWQAGSGCSGHDWVADWARFGLWATA